MEWGRIVLGFSLDLLELYRFYKIPWHADRSSPKALLYVENLLCSHVKARR